jgi:hypothetical protein
MRRTWMAIGMAAVFCAHAACAQTAGPPPGAPFIAPDAPPNMTPADFGRGGWVFYNNVFVNKASGFCLGVRAQEVEVYVEDIKWWNGQNPVGKPITSILGNEVVAGPDFEHHGVYQYGIILFQPGQTPGEVPRAVQLLGSNRATPTLVALDRSKDICFAVNDKHLGGYDRNGGSFDLNVRVVKP